MRSATTGATKSTKKRPVWRSSPWLLSFQTAVWHARCNGFRLNVATTDRGHTLAFISQRRKEDGGITSPAERTWSTADDSTVEEARLWCENAAAELVRR